MYEFGVDADPDRDDFFEKYSTMSQEQKRYQKGRSPVGENITTKRPGNGMSSMEWYSVIGTAAVRDFREDELIEVL